MNGNFAPYIYNNRSTHTNNGTRPTRQSETPVSTPFYHPNSTGSKTYQGWNHRPQQSNNRSFNKNTHHQDHNYGRVMTEGNPLHQKHPQTNSINNYNQQFQMPAYYPNQLQNVPSRNNGGEVYKSSIYQNKSNSFTGQNGSQPIIEKTNLNQSGGNNKTNFNPPKRMPRASQPSFPSQLYMQDSNSKTNLQTQASLHNLSTISKQQHNFAKVKGSNGQSIRKQQKNNLSQSPKLQQKKQKQSSSPYIRKNASEVRQDSQIKIRGPTLQPNHMERIKKKFTINDFNVVKNLGSGKYGRVYLALQKASGFICALKVIEKKLLKQEDIVQQYIRQIKIQMYLHHPHIIKMYGYFDDEKNIYTILELSMGGQLFHQLKKSHQMAENKVAMYMRQVCDAVRQIHSLQIIHRDIKPENIVLHENIVKLCDFGWSVHQDKSLRTTFCGTPLYVCPEILKGKDYNQQIDIWSLGVMMYEMLVGQNPFKITKQQELIKIIKDEVIIPSYVTISKQAKDFLDKCLKKNPGDRATIRQLVEHEFFKKYPDKTAEKKMSFN